MKNLYSITKRTPKWDRADYHGLERHSLNLTRNDFNNAVTFTKYKKHEKHREKKKR